MSQPQYSRMSAIGAVLCCAAVALTIFAQKQLGEDLDKIGEAKSSRPSNCPTAASTRLCR